MFLEGVSWRRPLSERRLPSPQVSRTFTTPPVPAIIFFLSDPEARRGVLGSRAIDHCRESHAFAQVSIQGSFPPLRCTNPPLCMCVCVCVCVCVHISSRTTHEIETRRDSRGRLYSLVSRGNDRGESEHHAFPRSLRTFSEYFSTIARELFAAIVFENCREF